MSKIGVAETKVEKNLGRWESNPGPQFQYASMLPLSHHHCQS